MTVKLIRIGNDVLIMDGAGNLLWTVYWPPIAPGEPEVIPQNVQYALLRALHFLE